MEPLQQVIVALRREIETALQQRQPLPHGARLEAERVVVTLQFCINDAVANGKTGVSFDVPSSDMRANGKTSPASAHSLTIEFKSVPVRIVDDNSSGDMMLQAPESPVTSEASIEGTEADQITQQLTKVFGAPGFDSSARASVFREAFENLSEKETADLIASLRGTPADENDTVVKHSLALLNRVCRSGPAGLAPGKAILGKLFQRHPAKSIVQLVSTVWKSQQEWMT